MRTVVPRGTRFVIEDTGEFILATVGFPTPGYARFMLISLDNGNMYTAPYTAPHTAPICEGVGIPVGALNQLIPESTWGRTTVEGKPLKDWLNPQPRIEEWTVTMHPRLCLHGKIYGRDGVPNGCHATTSKLKWINFDKGEAQTQNTLYKLGRPA